MCFGPHRGADGVVPPPRCVSDGQTRCLLSDRRSRPCDLDRRSRGHLVVLPEPLMTVLCPAHARCAGRLDRMGSTTLEEDVRAVCVLARQAAREMALYTTTEKNRALEA